MTKIIGHRGFSSAAPENTISSLKEAIRIGCEYFELDVQCSKDGVPFVLHDPTLNRTSSNFKGHINQFLSHELAEAKVGFPAKFGERFKNEKLPRLKDALQMAKGKITICIEIKTTGSEERIVELIEELELTSDVIIFSFLPDILKKMHSMHPSLKLLFLTETASTSDIKKCVNLNAFALGIGAENSLNFEFLNHCHAKGIELWMWTVNKTEDIQKCIELGLDGLITDFPNKAQDILAKKGLNTAYSSSI